MKYKQMLVTTMTRIIIFIYALVITKFNFFFYK